MASLHYLAKLTIIVSKSVGKRKTLQIKMTVLHLYDATLCKIQLCGYLACFWPSWLGRLTNSSPLCGSVQGCAGLE